MKSKLTRCSIVAAAVIAAITIGGCHNDNNGQPAPPTSNTNEENFSTLANQVYAMDANSTPVNFDGVTIIYDVDTDPTAFNALFMM